MFTQPASESTAREPHQYPLSLSDAVAASYLFHIRRYGIHTRIRTVLPTKYPSPVTSPFYGSRKCATTAFSRLKKAAQYVSAVGKKPATTNECFIASCALPITARSANSGLNSARAQTLLSHARLYNVTFVYAPPRRRAYI